jgi:hypothetical protein
MVGATEPVDESDPRAAVLGEVVELVRVDLVAKGEQ